MKDKLLLALVILAIVVTAFVLINFQINRADATVRDISEGSFSTSTYYSSVSSIAQGGCVLLKGVTGTTVGPASGKVGGVLENIAFGGTYKSGALAINFFNATTSDINKRTGNTPTSTIVLAEVYGGHSSTTIPINATFDTGLLMCVNGTPASSTATWK